MRRRASREVSCFLMCVDERIIAALPSALCPLPSALCLCSHYIPVSNGMGSLFASVFSLLLPPRAGGYHAA